MKTLKISQRKSIFSLDSMIELKIIPLGDIEEIVLNEICSALKEKFKARVRVTPSVALPEEAHNKLRDQYLAVKIIEYLANNYEGRILGVTNKDLYAMGLNFVFGQAQLNGRVAVISLYRLDPGFYRKKGDYTLLIKRARKEAVHEIGHTLGLTHCANTSCVMCFSNTIFDVDEKSEDFCELCKLRLK